MYHNRSMSECLNGNRVIEQHGAMVRVRQDIETQMERLFLCANTSNSADPANLPMRQRNLPSSFFHPPRDSSNQDLTNGFSPRPVSTANSHHQFNNVSHTRNMSFDLQALNWRDQNNNSTNINNNNPHTQHQPSHHLSNGNIFRTTSNNTNMLNNLGQSRASNNIITTTTNVISNNDGHNNPFISARITTHAPSLVSNTTNSIHGSQDVSQAVSASCLLNLDVEADMARLRQNRRDVDRFLSSAVVGNPEPAPLMDHHANEYPNSPSGGSNTQLAGYQSSASGSTGIGSASGSGSMFNSSSSPSINNQPNNLLLKPQAPYHHMRQTSVDSGLGYTTYAQKWPNVHHAHHHSVSVVPSFCSAIASDHNPANENYISTSNNNINNNNNNTINNNNSGTMLTSSTMQPTNNDAQSYHMDPDIDPDNIIPTLSDIDPQLSIEDYINYPLV